eukprot:4467556-Prymnesium_polylepis.1
MIGQTSARTSCRAGRRSPGNCRQWCGSGASPSTITLVRPRARGSRAPPVVARSLCTHARMVPATAPPSCQLCAFLRVLVLVRALLTG